MEEETHRRRTDFYSTLTQLVVVSCDQHFVLQNKFLNSQRYYRDTDIYNF